MKRRNRRFYLTAISPADFEETGDLSLRWPCYHRHATVQEARRCRREQIRQGEKGRIAVVSIEAYNYFKEN